MSSRPSEEVSEHERQYEDGSDPRVLDIIDVPLKSHHPKSYQSENWLLDPDHYWKLAGRMVPAGVAALSDDPPALWLNGSSTGAGSNDRVALAASRGADWVALPAPPRRSRTPGLRARCAFGNPKRRVQAGFVHHGVNYRLWVTDPLVERRYLAGPDGAYRLGQCFSTISLGEPHEGYCYKLVAALITPGADTGENG